MPRGGARKGAGRRPSGAVAGVPHVRRSVPAGRRLRIGIRTRNDRPGFRDRRLRNLTARAIEILGNRIGVHVAEHWVADRVLWLVVEASAAATLARAMQGFGVRVAKGVNKKLGTSGAVLADRYAIEVIPPRSWRERLGGVVRGAGGFLALAAVATVAATAIAAAPRMTLGGRGWVDYRERNRIEREVMRELAREKEARERRRAARRRRFKEKWKPFVRERLRLWQEAELARGRDEREVRDEYQERLRAELIALHDGTWRPPRARKA